MKKQAFNPYLPSYEYIPDGEPHVFGDRVYIYGSHGRYNGHGYCLNDYVCYSAKVDELWNWKYEGVIYTKQDDPLNNGKNMCMFAPDVCRGADGRYYLYYVFDAANVVSVAVCDEPAGKYHFYGYVKYPSGVLLGEAEGDHPQFDPAVLFEDGKVYLYTGSCFPNDTSNKGSTVTVLCSDMLTVKEAPKVIIPSKCASLNTGFEGHEFFEASSIRKADGRYYFVYSSVLCHELCYAISDFPTGPFEYKGTIISACDIGIDAYKPAKMPIAQKDNNHGGMECINGEWYIFYHRHTNGHGFTRQGCAEKIEMDANGNISQVRVSSCGLNGKPLVGKGEYPAYIACALFRLNEHGEVCLACEAPCLTMEEAKEDSGEQYITNIHNNAVIGFRSFDFVNVSKITLKTAGFISSDCRFEVLDCFDGEPLGTVYLNSSNGWVYSTGAVNIPDGTHDLYFRYKGSRKVNFAGFIIE